VQCGLSISETATFCQVCGARYDGDATVATLDATQVVEGPPPDADGPAGGADRWSEAQPYEPGAELVADLAAEPEPSEPEASAPETAGESSGLEADVSAGPTVEPTEAVPDPEAPTPAQLEQAAPEPAEPGPELEDAAPEPAEPEPEPEDVAPQSAELEPEPEETAPALEPDVEPATTPQSSARDRKLAAVAVLLEAASVCEDADMSRAAALYQEAILGCLDAADGAGGFAGVEPELLRGFDGLSALLQRRGLAEEALEVVDEAAALSLLNGGERVAGGHCDALLVRREDLRRLLYADSAGL